MGEIGYNGGPSLAGGVSWRKHCWSAARERLLPTLPIEVVRLRVKRSSVEMEKIFEEMQEKGTRAADGQAPASPFAEITDEDIDALFSE